MLSFRTLGISEISTFTKGTCGGPPKKTSEGVGWGHCGQWYADYTNCVVSVSGHQLLTTSAKQKVC